MAVTKKLSKLHISYFLDEIQIKAKKYKELGFL